MFQDTMSERASVDLSAPGALEAEIGKFVQKRVAMRDATGRACTANVEKSGEDPTNQDSALVMIRFDCGGTTGTLFYDATKLLATQGAKGKHLVTLEGSENAGQTMLYPDDPPLDLSKPMETTAQLMWKFLKAGVEHIVTGYDHLCFLFALILWANRICRSSRSSPLHHFAIRSRCRSRRSTFHAALDVVEALIAARSFSSPSRIISRDVDNRWRNTFSSLHPRLRLRLGADEMGVPRRRRAALAAFNIGVELARSPSSSR
jgi:hypothetical protein